MDDRCGCGVDDDGDDLDGGGGGRVHDGGRPLLNVKLGAYGENPPVFNMYVIDGRSATVRGSMTSCWVPLGRETLRSRGFVSGGGLIRDGFPIEFHIYILTKFHTVLTPQIPFPILERTRSSPIVPTCFCSQPALAVGRRYHLKHFTSPDTISPNSLSHPSLADIFLSPNSDNFPIPVDHVPLSRCTIALRDQVVF